MKGTRSGRVWAVSVHAQHGSEVTEFQKAPFRISGTPEMPAGVAPSHAPFVLSFASCTPRPLPENRPTGSRRGEKDALSTRVEEDPV